jgi:putative oxidoreductase
VKKILSVNEATTTTDIALLIARIGIAALMLTHGIPKLMMLFPGAPVQFPSVFGMSAKISLALTVFAEVFCSIFLLAGFATRLAVIPLVITMLVAAFLIHAADPLSVKEPALYYLLVYTVLLFAGSGKYSIDYFLQKRRMTIKYAGRKVQDSMLGVYQ